MSCVSDTGNVFRREKLNCNGCACILMLKNYASCIPLGKSIKFCSHFILVMVSLYLGAIIFAKLEDPELLSAHGAEHNDTLDIAINANLSLLWKSIESAYNLSMDADVRENFFRDMNGLFALQKKQEEHRTYQHQVRNREYIFMKWFHFVTVATTTIGYGNIYPKTDIGKLFYIFFSILGIILMMTLLKSCGILLTETNKSFYALIFRHRRCKKVISEELLSVISITIIYLVFMLVGIWHDTNIEGVNWSVIDTVYFWIVTFTTVGFGDITYPLEVEIEHVYGLLVYRVFGLALLAGIIDSLQQYLKFRKKLLKEKAQRISTDFKKKLVGNSLDLTIPILEVRVRQTATWLQ